MNVENFGNHPRFAAHGQNTAIMYSDSNPDYRQRGDGQVVISASPVEAKPLVAGIQPLRVRGDLREWHGVFHSIGAVGSSHMQGCQILTNKGFD